MQRAQIVGAGGESAGVFVHAGEERAALGRGKLRGACELLQQVAIGGGPCSAARVVSAVGCQVPPTSW